MKVCLVTYGTFLDPARVAAGNSVRAYYTTRALVERGIEVVHLHPASLGGRASGGTAVLAGVRIDSYQDGADLLARIDREKPDAVLVGYWEILDHFPEGYAYPLIVDVVAPRILESLFESGRDLGREARRLIELYRRADLFLAGNERQRHFLVPWLILAGFRCAEGVPVAVVPLSTAPALRRAEMPWAGVWRFVSGGVTWPWRRTEPYLEPLVASLARGPGRLDLFEGRYVYASEEAGPGPQPRRWPADHVRSRELLPYGEMQAFLGAECDVGVELAEYNLEREFSQSFRSTEFLRHGLPLLCNRYLELADSIEAYDAGWVVGSPGEVPKVVAEICADRTGWEMKSRNALRLVEERLHYARTIAPVVAFLENPRAPDRAPSPLLARPPSLSMQPGASRAASPTAWGRWLGRGVAGLLGKLAPPRGDAVLIVTRNDLFPADHGAAVKIDRTARAMAMYASAVYVATGDRERYWRYRDGRVTEKRYPWLLRVLGPSQKRVRERVLAAHVPSEDAFLYYPRFDWSFVARVLYLAWRRGARRYQAEFPAYAVPCLWARRLLGGVAAIAEHNVEYRRLAEQHPGMPDGTREWLRDLEVGLCNRSDFVVVVSAVDREALVAGGVTADRIRVIPHGVDLGAFAVASPGETRARLGLAPGVPLLVYHGAFGYPPNLEAIQVLARDILPRLHARGIYPKVLAIGPLPPAVSLHPDILFTGSVPEVAPYLLDADVAVVPLRRGGGTRMKVLDYLAAGLPVVSTAKGVEGLGLKDGEQALIRDDPDAFASAVAELLGMPARRSALAATGRRLVAGLDWSIIGERYVAEFNGRG